MKLGNILELSHFYFMPLLVTDDATYVWESIFLSLILLGVILRIHSWHPDPNEQWDIANVGFLDLFSRESGYH